MPLEVPDDSQPLGNAVIRLTESTDIHRRSDTATRGSRGVRLLHHHLPGRPDTLAQRIPARADDACWHGRAITVNGLPPGTYLVAALGDLEPDDLLDPAFRRAGAAQMQITIGEGEHQTQNLRVSR